MNKVLITKAMFDQIVAHMQGLNELAHLLEDSPKSLQKHINESAPVRERLMEEMRQLTTHMGEEHGVVNENAYRQTFDGQAFYLMVQAIVDPSAGFRLPAPMRQPTRSPASSKRRAHLPTEISTWQRKMFLLSHLFSIG